ncbi:MAG: Smr/MutS family protein [Maritimibacter sp.]
MSRRKPRNLRPDEVELWSKVVEKAAPMHPERSTLPDRPVEKQIQAKANPAKPAMPRFRVGEASRPTPPRHDLAPSINEHVAQQPVQMDHKRFSQLKKGRLSPEARIDLHGLTIAQAHPALTRFILDAAADEKRLVLVITGKGKSRPDTGPIPERHGALRHQVPHWLNMAPLKPHVLQITEAHVKHGGQGAYYVYLRRAR